MAAIEPAADWFYRVAGAKFGPVESAELRRLADKGIVMRGTPIRKGADSRWMLARQVSGLFDPRRPTPFSKRNPPAAQAAPVAKVDLPKPQKRTTVERRASRRVVADY